MSEYGSFAKTFSASKTVTWSISGGVDSDKFQVYSNTGSLSFNEKPDFENPNDSDLDLVLNFDEAIDVVNKKSNLILYRVNGNKTKRVAVNNMHTNKENYFSNGDTKITINIGPKIADN